MMQWQRNSNSILKSLGDRGVYSQLFTCYGSSMVRHCAGEKLCEAVYGGKFSDSGCIGNFVFFFFGSGCVEEGVYIDIICLGG